MAKSYSAILLSRPRDQAAMPDSQDWLLASLGDMNEQHWVEFLGDVIDGKPSASEVLEPGKGDDLILALSIRLQRLGAATRRCAGVAVQRLLVARLVAPRSRRIHSPRSLRNLVHLSYFVTENVYPTTLLHIVLDTSLTKEIRVAAAKALANRADELPAEIWQRIQAEALQGLPELLAPVLAGLGTRYPIEALDLLAQVEKYIARTELLESPLRLILRKILVLDSGWVHVARVLRSAPGWAREVLSRVLHFSEFSQSAMLVSRLGPYLPLAESHTVQLPGSNDPSPPPVMPAEGDSPFPRAESRRWIEDALVQALDRYRNAGASDQDHVDALLALVGENPSTPVFGALVGFMEGVLLDSLLGTSKLSEDGVDQILRQVLESFRSMAATIRKLSSSSQGPELSMWQAFRRSLQLALKRAAIAELAFAQLADHENQQGVVLAVRLALGQDHFAAQQCREILLRYWPPISCDSILSGVIDLESELLVEALESDSDLFKVATKLRTLDTRYLGSGEVDEATACVVTLVDEETMPTDYQEWASQRSAISLPSRYAF